MSNTKKIITHQQLKEHGHKDDLWVLIEGKVYDCKEFIHEHPGGYESLMEGAGNGIDSTKPFRDQGHSDVAERFLLDLYIGDFDQSSWIQEPTKKSILASSTSNYLKYGAFAVSFFAYITWRISLRS